MSDNQFFNFVGRPSGALPDKGANQQEPAGEALHRWEYLEARAHSWRKQLFVKGTRIPASAVWLDMQTNALFLEEASENFELPVSAIEEIVIYCELNREFVAKEAEEERSFLEEQGVRVEPAAW